MASTTSPTSSHPGSRPSFPELPPEIRQKVYRHYFSSVLQHIRIYITDSCPMTVLPCTPHENYLRLVARAQKLNLPLHLIGDNRAIAILLINRAINLEATPVLYEDKMFYCGRNERIANLPSGLRINLRHLVLDAGAIFSYLPGSIIRLLSYPNGSDTFATRQG